MVAVAVVEIVNAVLVIFAVVLVVIAIVFVCCVSCVDCQLSFVVVVGLDDLVTHRRVTLIFSLAPFSERQCRTGVRTKIYIGEVTCSTSIPEWIRTP